jgi:hypothetical protein
MIDLEALKAKCLKDLDTPCPSLSPMTGLELIQKIEDLQKLETLLAIAFGIYGHRDGVEELRDYIYQGLGKP